MQDDEEYTAALASELEELQKNLATLRQERDEGKKTVRQLRTEQIFLRKQKEQREKYHEFTVQKDLVQKQLSEKKRQKKNALQQLVDARETPGKKVPDSHRTSDADVSEITFQCDTDDTDKDVDELHDEVDLLKGNDSNRY